MTTPSPVDEKSIEIVKASQKYSLESLIPTLDRIGGTRTGPVVVNTDHTPPASLEGSSCLYILHIYKADAPHVADHLYVGETESFNQRLQVRIRSTIYRF